MLLQTPIGICTPLQNCFFSSLLPHSYTHAAAHTSARNAVDCGFLRKLYFILPLYVCCFSSNFLTFCASLRYLFCLFPSTQYFSHALFSDANTHMHTHTYTWPGLLPLFANSSLAAHFFWFWLIFGTFSGWTVGNLPCVRT